jgi:hypothetical protein
LTLTQTGSVFVAIKSTERRFGLPFLTGVKDLSVSENRKFGSAQIAGMRFLLLNQLLKLQHLQHSR